MALRLKDKVCVITGTSGSIGRAAAQRFAQEGALVVGCGSNAVTSQETVDMVRAEGGRMTSLHPVDLGNMADCQRLVDLAISEHGRIDVLFNNAAMAHFNWIEDITEDEWHRNTRNEVDLVFFLTKCAWPHLKKSGGAIVNTASLTGWRAFRTLGGLAHATAKMGIVGMTKQLATREDSGVSATNPSGISSEQPRHPIGQADQNHRGQECWNDEQCYAILPVVGFDVAPDGPHVLRHGLVVAFIK